MVNDYTPSCASSSAPDVAFSWTAPASGLYNFTTIGSSFDTVLTLRNAVGGQVLGCNDDISGSYQSSLSVNLSAGQKITIIVDGYSAASGSYRLNIFGPPPSGGILPTANLKLWLKADANVWLDPNTGKVFTWQDQSGNNNHAYVSIPARQPGLVPGALNGLPVVRFLGAQSLALTNMLKPSTFTVFVVGKNSMPSETFSMILGPGQSSANNQLRWENGSQALVVGTGNNLPVITSNIGNTRAYHVLMVRYDGSQMSVYRDGYFISSHAFATSGTWDLYQIAAWYSQNFMQGDLAEILFYDAAIPPFDTSTVDWYLEGKYGLP